MKRPLHLLLALLFVLVAAAGCAPAKPEEGLKDFLGDPVSFGKFPERIVSLTPSNTEIVFALGMGGKLVGVDTVSDYPEAVAAIAKAGDFNGPNLEVIASLKPDLVLAGNKLQKEAVEQVRALGINVAAVEATEYADVYKSIELVGKLIGAEQKARELISRMKAQEKAVLDTVAGAAPGTTVYYAMTFGEMGNWTGGPGSFPFEFINLCGGKNITEGLPVPWVDFSMEELVAKNPDVILLADDAGDPEAFKAADGYKDLKAVKEGRVIVVNADLCSRPGPRIVEGLRVYAEAITGKEIRSPGE